MKSARMLIGAAVAIAMTATPVMAAGSASQLSLKAVRASTKATNKSAAIADFLLPGIAIVAIVGGALLITDDEPDSP
jgi:hypothetical protein